jgi:hypothetical protein
VSKSGLLTHGEIRLRYESTTAALQRTKGN